MLAWCCCRCNEEGNGTGEEHVKAKATPLGLSDAELLGACTEVQSPFQTPRETSAQRFVTAKRSDSAASKDHLPTSSVPTTAATTTGGTSTRPKRPSLTPEAKEHEKEKLKALVHEFAKKAATEGIMVDIGDLETGKTYKYLFEMDKYLMWFTLTPVGASQQLEQTQHQGGVAIGKKRQYMMANVVSVWKGRDIASHLTDTTSLHVPIPNCVLVESQNPDERLFFVFSDAHTRRKFYTCLKIIRMSVAISRNKQHEGTAA